MHDTVGTEVPSPHLNAEVSSPDEVNIQVYVYRYTCTGGTARAVSKEQLGSTCRTSPGSAPHTKIGPAAHFTVFKWPTLPLKILQTDPLRCWGQGCIVILVAEAQKLMMYEQACVAKHTQHAAMLHLFK